MRADAAAKVKELSRVGEPLRSLGFARSLPECSSKAGM